MFRSLLLFTLISLANFVHAVPPIDLGSRLELLADDYLLEHKNGEIDFHVHQPEAKEVVFTADAPWEGNTSGYYSLFEDGDKYRMIYRGWQHDPSDIRKQMHPEVVCLAESDDGIHWRKPSLGLFEFDGSIDNNIIWNGIGSHNFTAFKDSNPNCPSDARYKALGSGKGGLFYFKSSDAIHWEIAHDKAVITKGAFDSQNLAFWDPQKKQYRAYWRIFSNGVRAIRTATSEDFLHWEPHTDLTYPEGTPKQHLYTNAIQKYFRAPHLFLGFPTRFLPDEDQRVEPIVMLSRDGEKFQRYNQPVIPESAPADRAGNRSNYMAWGMLTLPDRPEEISVYATEAYYGPVPTRIRRFVYRLDGFVSLRAGAEGGEVVTKPIIFDGSTLILNYATHPKGKVQVEIQDASGKPISGFTLSESIVLSKDSVQATVSWNGNSNLRSLAVQPIRIRMVAKNADLYSLRFE